MDVQLVSLSAIGAAMVPVVVGVTQVVKSFVTDTRYIPIVAIVLGILASFVAPAVTLALTIFQGVLIGLAAIGLFSGAKTLLN